MSLPEFVTHESYFIGLFELSKIFLFWDVFGWFLLDLRLVSNKVAGGIFTLLS